MLCAGGTWWCSARSSSIAGAATVDALRGRAAAPTAAADGRAAGRAGGRPPAGAPTFPPPARFPARSSSPSRGNCRLRTLSLETLVVGDAGPTTGCELWASPAGAWVVASTASTLNPRNPRPLSLVRLGEGSAEVDRELGQALGQPAWAPDGPRSRGAPRAARRSFAESGRRTSAVCRAALRPSPRTEQCSRFRPTRSTRGFSGTARRCSARRS